MNNTGSRSPELDTVLPRRTLEEVKDLLLTDHRALHTSTLIQPRFKKDEEKRKAHLQVRLGSLERRDQVVAVDRDGDGSRRPSARRELQNSHLSRSIYFVSPSDQLAYSPGGAEERRTLKSNPVRPQFEVLLSPDRVSTSKAFLDINKMRVDDLLREGQRAVEDRANFGKLLKEVGVRRGDRVVVLGRRRRERRGGDGGEGAGGLGEGAGRPQGGTAEGKHPCFGERARASGERSGFKKVESRGGRQEGDWAISILTARFCSSSLTGALEP